MKYTLTNKAIAILLSIIILLGSASGFMTLSASSVTVNFSIISGSGRLFVNTVEYEDLFYDHIPVEAGTTVNFEARPDSGLRVVWFVNSVEYRVGGNFLDLEITENVNVTVLFELDTLNLFFDDNIVSAKRANNDDLHDGDAVAEHAIISFSAPVPTGNDYTEWFSKNILTGVETPITGITVSAGREVFSFTMPDYSVEIIRNLLTGYEVDFGVSAGLGTLKAHRGVPASTEIFSGNAVAQGATVTFTAEPEVTEAHAYRLQKWEVRVAGVLQSSGFTQVGNTLTLVVNEETDVRVFFEEITLTLENYDVTVSEHAAMYVLIGGSAEGDITLVKELPASWPDEEAFSVEVGLNNGGLTSIIINSTYRLTDDANTEDTPLKLLVTREGITKVLSINIDLPHFSIVGSSTVNIDNKNTERTITVSANMPVAPDAADTITIPYLPTGLSYTVTHRSGDLYDIKITATRPATGTVSINDPDMIIQNSGLTVIFELIVNLTPPPQITSIIPTEATVTAFENVRVYGSGTVPPVAVNAVFDITGANFSVNVQEVEESIRSEFLSHPAWITAGVVNVEVTGNTTATVTIPLTVLLNNPGSFRSSAVTIGTDTSISTGVTGTLPVSQVGPISLSPAEVTVTEGNIIIPVEVTVAGSGTISMPERTDEFIDNVHISFSGSADENKILITTTRPSQDITDKSFDVTFTRDGLSSTLTINVDIKALDSPTVTWPTGFSANYWQLLSDISPNGSVSGSANFESTPVNGKFVWTQVLTAPDTRVGNAGTQYHQMTFIPDNTAIYAMVTTTGAEGTLQGPRAMTVSKVDPSVTFPTGLSLEYRQTLSEAVATVAGSAEYDEETVTGTFTFTRSDAGTYQPTVAQSGYYEMIFTPTGTDALNFNTATSSVYVTVRKAPQSAPAAPTMAGRSASSITINPITDAQYIIKTTSTAPTSAEWLDATTSLLFEELAPNTPYYIFARLIETANLNPSPSSAAATIWTEKAALVGTPVITGNATYLETLTVIISALYADPPGNSTAGREALGTPSYQWYQNGSTIGGATGSSYTLTTADVETVITVTVGTENTNNTVTSAPTGEVAKRLPVRTDLSYTLTPVIFDAQEHSVAVSAAFGIVGLGDISVKYLLYDSNDEWSDEKPVNAGVYQLKVILTEGTYYLDREILLDDGYFIIEKAQPDIDDLEVTLPGVFPQHNVDWDNSSHSATVIADASSILEIETDDITVFYSLAGDERSTEPPVAPGIYIVSVDITEGDNYSAATNLIVGSFTIEGVNITAGVSFSPADTTYNGQSHKITVSDIGEDTTEGGTIYYRLSESDVWEEAEQTFKNATIDMAGVLTPVTVYFRIIRHDSGYNPYYGEATVTIRPAPLSWSSGNTVNNKSYDGNTSATILKAPELIGIVEDEAVTVSAGTASFVSANAADGIGVTAASWGVEGADAGNYLAPSSEPLFASANITPRQLYWSSTNTVENKEYDGDNIATVDVSPTLVGLLSSNTVSITTGSALFNSKNAAQNITINANGWGISGDSNYAAPLAQPDFASADILKVTLTPSIDFDGVNGRVYNGGTSITGAQPVILLEGAVNSEEPEATALFAFSDINIGANKNVNATSITLTGEWGVNYKLSEYTLTQASGLEITPLQLLWSSGSVDDKIYDGDRTATVNIAPTLIGILEADIGTVTITTGSVFFDNADAEKNITLTAEDWDIEGNENYAAPAAQPEFTTASIDPRPITGNINITVTDTDPVDGRIVEGTNLTADLKNVVGVPGGAEITTAHLSFEWYRDGVLIVDETSDTYTIGIDDYVNANITVKISGIDNFTGEMESNAVTVGLISANGEIIISGLPLLNETLEIVWEQELTPAAATYSITWLREGTPIFGATAMQYIITKDDLGKTLTVEINATGDYTGFFMTGISISAVPPNVPQALSATPGNTKVLLQWSAPDFDGGSEIIKYQLSKNEGAQWVDIGLTTSFDVTELINDIEYTFWLRAVNKIGHSNYISVTATPVAPPVIIAIIADEITDEIFKNVPEVGFSGHAVFEIHGENLTEEAVLNENVFSVAEFPAWLLPSNLSVEFISSELAKLTITLTVRENGETARSGIIRISNTITEEVTGTLSVSQAAAPAAEEYKVIILNSPNAVAVPTGQSTSVRSYLPGSIVSLDAGRVAGYLFEGWHSESSGVVINSDNKAETSFIMPGNDVVIVAGWLRSAQDIPHDLPSDEDPPDITSPDTDDNPKTGENTDSQSGDDTKQPGEQPSQIDSKTSDDEMQIKTGFGAWLSKNLLWILLSCGALVIFVSSALIAWQKIWKKKAHKTSALRR